MDSHLPQYFKGPFICKDTIDFRKYQQNIFKKCRKKNSLVVLSTGLGKTIIGILLVAHCLKKYNMKGKVIILAPTRPLVSQHQKSCENFLNIQNEKIIRLTGRIKPEKRIVQFNQARIIISTPQVIKNDIERGRYDLTEVALMIFDEAHRTVGNYSYTYLAEEYIKTCLDPLILGLTASPGKNYEKIQDLCDNLYVENIVFKTHQDKDVKDYIHDIDIFLENLELPLPYLEVREVWDELFQNFLRFFIQRDLINPHKSYYSKLDFLGITHDLNISLRYDNPFEIEEFEEQLTEELFYTSPKIIDIVEENSLDIHSIFSYCSSCISILHAKELLETQNFTLFNSFLEKLEYKAGQDILAAKRIVSSEYFKLIQTLLREKDYEKVSHPKLGKLVDIIEEEFINFENDKLIIFTQYREMAEFLKNSLSKRLNRNLSIEKFIGQSHKASESGFSQSHQIEILEKFREDKINILVATSVAEEGLDIPNVNAIIFYEPVPSEIRLIQRRGRTGRHSPGRCYILITKDTVDVPFYRVSRRKENTMNTILAQPEELELNAEIERKKIKFEEKATPISEYDLLKNYKERRKKEKELMANRSIDEIIDQLDKFSKSKKYKKLKNQGVTFFSDVVNLNKSKLKQKVKKMKGNNKKKDKKPKRYLNNNVKTLIDLADLYCEDGGIMLSKFKELAEEEDIIDRKFYIHLNQCCYLGYLKRDKYDKVHFIKHYS